MYEKAKMIYEELKRKQTSLSSQAEQEEFKASWDWFHRFQKRNGNHISLVMHEVARADKQAAEKFAKDFQNLVKVENNTPHPFLNCDEAGLCWKRILNKTFITEEENKPINDRLTLFASNAVGLMKLKSMLVYHCESPRIFKKKAAVKSKLEPG